MASTNSAFKIVNEPSAENYSVTDAIYQRFVDYARKNNVAKDEKGEHQKEYEENRDIEKEGEYGDGRRSKEEEYEGSEGQRQLEG